MERLGERAPRQQLTDGGATYLRLDVVRVLGDARLRIPTRAQDRRAGGRPLCESHDSMSNTPRWFRKCQRSRPFQCAAAASASQRGGSLSSSQ